MKFYYKTAHGVSDEPVSAADLLELVKTGTLGPEDKIRDGRLGSWIPVHMLITVDRQGRAGFARPRSSSSSRPHPFPMGSILWSIDRATEWSEGLFDRAAMTRGWWRETVTCMLALLAFPAFLIVRLIVVAIILSVVALVLWAVGAFR